MDMGATLCTRAQPDCAACPLQARCLAFAQQRVNDFPQPKVRKTLPVRSCQMLVIRNERNEIYLEKRPNQGVWGGLWCLPQLPLDVAAETACFQWRQNSVVRVGEAAVFRHTFSHFHLDIQPVFLRISEAPLVIAENNSGRWVTLAELNNLGLAAPVTKILQALSTQETIERVSYD